MFSNHSHYKNLAKNLMKTNSDKFKLSDMTKELDKIMEKYTKDLSTNVAVELPQLKRVGGEDIPNDTGLPQLKRVGV